MWKRELTAWIDRIAVPAAAAVVAWIAVSAWIAPHAPMWVPEFVLEVIGAGLAFAIAWRVL